MGVYPERVGIACLVCLEESAVTGGRAHGFTGAVCVHHHAASVEHGGVAFQFGQQCVVAGQGVGKRLGVL